jgi:hypothetical protein
MRAGLNFDGPSLTRAARARVRGRGARIATAQIACKVERLVGVNETGTRTYLEAVDGRGDLLSRLDVCRAGGRCGVGGRSTLKYQYQWLADPCNPGISNLPLWCLY